MKLLSLDMLRDTEQMAVRTELVPLLREITRMVNSLPEMHGKFNVGKAQDLEKSLLQIDYVSTYTQYSMFHQQGLGGLCSQTFELKDPFYILSIDEVYKIYDVISEGSLATHIQKFETNSLSHMNHFHGFFDAWSKRSDQLEFPLLEFVPYYSASSFLYLSSRHMPILRILKYYRHLNTLLHSWTQYACLTLDWWDVFHLQHLLLFNKNFDDHDLSKEIYYHTKNDTQDPSFAVMQYDSQLLDPKQSENDNHLSNKTILNQALDKLIEKVKSYYQIRAAFHQFDFQALKDKFNSQNYLIESGSQLLKSVSKMTRKKIFYILHQNIINIAKQVHSAPLICSCPPRSTHLTSRRSTRYCSRTTSCRA